MGGLYKRKDSKYFWMWYQDGTGETIDESTKTTAKTAAKEILRQREAQVTDHRFPGLNVEKTTFRDLTERMLRDFKINKKKSLPHMINLIKRLNNYFGEETKATVIPDMIPQFIEDLQQRGLENSYVNRHLAALRRMYSLGYKKPRIVIEKLDISMLSENNVRTGYLEHDFYIRLRKALPDYLKIALTVTYLSGIRKGECLSLPRSKVDFINGYISLNPLDTKSNEPRGFFLRGEYYEELLAWEQQTAKLYPECEFVIHRNGQRITDFREAWNSALMKVGKYIKYKCKDCSRITERTKAMSREKMVCANPKCKSTKLKRDDQIFHDLRRTGVRNLIDAGVPEKDAMYISGHKTTSILHRYKIVNRKNLSDAADKLVDYLRSQDRQYSKKGN